MPAAPWQQPPHYASQHTESHKSCDLAFIGISVAPPGFPDHPSRVPPLPLPPRRVSAAAAAGRAALLPALSLRLVSSAVVRFMRTQLGLTGAGLNIRRVWSTPSGRLAAHVALPTQLAAQVLARKRHRLRGTAYSVDLLRSKSELATQKVGRELQHQQQDASATTSGRCTTTVGQQCVATPAPAAWPPLTSHVRPIVFAFLLVILLIAFLLAHGFG